MCIMIIARDDLTEMYLNYNDSSGSSALHYAARYGSLKVVQALLGRKDFTTANAVDNSRRTALHYAAQNGSLAIATALVQHPDFPTHAEDSRGFTALHLACMGGHQGIMQL